MSIPKREDIDLLDTWDTTRLFQSLQSWEEEVSEVEELILELSKLENSFVENIDSFTSTLRTYLKTSEKIEKIYCYVKLLSDQDTSNNQNFSLKSKALNLYTRFAQASAFINPKIIGLDDATSNEYLEHVESKDLKRMISEIRRYKPHTLSQKEEGLLASLGETFRANQIIFSQLTNADFQFPDMEIEGTPQPLTHGTFVNYLKNSNRSIREQAWTKFYGVIDAHKYTLASTLTGAVNNNVAITKARNFNCPRSKSLFSDNIPVQVYDSLIEYTSDGLEQLHSYYSLRKELLSLDSLEIFDTYVPLVEDPKIEIPYSEACKWLSEAFSPLGEEYVEVLSKGLEKDRWVDRYENKGKLSGAYAMPSYSTTPFMLMNYDKNQLNDVFTLAHEAGHAMHTFYSAKHQNYQDYSYSIFVAEVASTFNEQLLHNYLANKFSDNSIMSAYLTNSQIDDIKGTFYRQAMFAEFEKLIQTSCFEGNPLSLDFFRETYHKLLEKYFGPSVSVSDVAELECLRIPHFYSPFYVYQYATGITAALTLSREVLEGNRDAKNRYLEFLSSGCSKHSIDLLKDAGVDLQKREPFDTIKLKFGNLLETLRSSLLKN